MIQSKRNTGAFVRIIPVPEQKWNRNSMWTPCGGMFKEIRTSPGLECTSLSEQSKLNSGEGERWLHGRGNLKRKRMKKRKEGRKLGCVCLGVGDSTCEKPFFRGGSCWPLFVSTLLSKTSRLLFLKWRVAIPHSPGFESSFLGCVGC